MTKKTHITKFKRRFKSCYTGLREINIKNAPEREHFCEHYFFPIAFTILFSLDFDLAAVFL